MINYSTTKPIKNVIKFIGDSSERHELLRGNNQIEDTCIMKSRRNKRIQNDYLQDLSEMSVLSELA